MLSVTPPARETFQALCCEAVMRLNAQPRFSGGSSCSPGTAPLQPILYRSRRQPPGASEGPAVKRKGPPASHPPSCGETPRLFWVSDLESGLS